MTSPPRIVIVAPSIPFDASPHAGGIYLQRVVRFAEERGPTTLLVPNTPTNREAMSRAGVPDDVHVVGIERATTTPGKLANRLVTVAESRLRRVDPGLPSLLLARGLIDGAAREVVAHADVVDLQWSESIRLAWYVRRASPHARLVGTFHDVQSQLFARERSASARRGGSWSLAAAQARHHEKKGVAALDEVATFSRKDALLLGDPPNLRVIHPPLAIGDELPREPPTGPPTVLFVGYLAREQNDHGALWLLREVWPAITAAVPDARLRIVGGGPSEALRAAAAASHAVALPGFVDDLDGEYAAASLVVVPLQQGAGLKFKTVEALLHDVPVVTTSVGAEGIDGPDLFAGLADDPAAFAAAVVGVLKEPGAARARADAAQSWARQEYSRETFETELAAHYAIG